MAEYNVLTTHGPKYVSSADILEKQITKHASSYEDKIKIEATSLGKGSQAVERSDLMVCLLIRGHFEKNRPVSQL